MNNKGKEKTNEKGRPSKYEEGFTDLAFNYCLLGATDKDLAGFFDVDESTINNWKNQYPDFLESIKKGKEKADAKIALSLYNRAKGAKINTQQAFKVKEVAYTDEGKRIESESIEIVNLQQEQPPDTTAAIFWLKNRKPQCWRDKIETVHSGEIGIVWNEEKTYEIKSETDHNT